MIRKKTALLVLYLCSQAEARPKSIAGINIDDGHGTISVVKPTWRRNGAFSAIIENKSGYRITSGHLRLAQYADIDASHILAAPVMISNRRRR